MKSWQSPIPKMPQQEMRQRVQEELRGTNLPASACRLFTSYCNELLIQNDKNFGVLDDQDLWIYLRRRIRELNLNYYVRAARLSKFFDDLLTFFRHCHDELVSPEQYEEYVQTAGAPRAARPAGHAGQKMPASFRTKKSWDGVGRSPAYLPPWNGCCGKTTWAPSAT